MADVTYIELLAPAKDLSVGRVAIESGADAVYIGGPAFGARKAAGNSLEDIGALCEYAHLFGVRVFVTLNTLIREEEMEEAVSLAYAYREIGVDAILIQDLRLARRLFASGNFEGMLHASTQCDVRDLARVQELEAMGFSQVVLARELSYAEMRAIQEQTHVALEAFVHGALCVSYSGACYLSEAVCGRSANRGECAQMCRLTYDVLDEQGREMVHGKHVLSLLDLDRSAHLRELLDAGVTTLKIEGRLKDADYVRNVVAYYRKRLDAVFAESGGRYAQASWGETRMTFEPDPAKTFHRGATEYFSFFSAGEASEKRPPHLVNMETPKSTGELLGRTPITASMGVRNGDGLVVGEQGFYWPSRVRVPAGVPVYRTYNADFQRQLAAKGATRRVLPVRMVLRELPEGFAVEIGLISPMGPMGPIGLISVSFEVEKVPAENGERAEAVVRQQLSKLGETVFEAREVTIDWSQAYFLPAATLNAWRREAVEKLVSNMRLTVSQTLMGCSLPILQKPPSQTAPSRPAPPSGQHAFEESRLQPNSPCGEDAKGIAGVEKEGEREGLLMPAELMTCKYCLLFEMGCCKKRKRGEELKGVPTYLRRGDLMLRIETDCKECVMMVVRG